MAKVPKISDGGVFRFKRVYSSHQGSGDIMENGTERMSYLGNKKWQLAVGTGEDVAVFRGENH